MAQQNKTAVKTYGTKAAAETAFKQKMANANKFTSPTAPSTTPDYVPKTVTINNNPVPVTYGQLSNGDMVMGIMIL